MRLVIVAFLVLSVSATTSEARGKHKAAAKHETAKRATKHDHGTSKRRVAHLSKKGKAKLLLAIKGPIRGQSIGAPWLGKLKDPSRLPPGEGYLIRRPARSYGTRTTVAYVERVIDEVREQFPEMHVLAIGDISAEHGGQISEHHSHQSGRDADIGLIYTKQPDGYPESFVVATEDNLDFAATFALIEGFAATADEDGGVQMMFLDYDLQGMIVRWARDAGVDAGWLERTFQWPRRGATDALIRHEPNHKNHLHVRFRCPRGDSACR